MRMVVVALMATLVLAGCRATETRGQAPGLTSVYGDLSLYWHTVAASIGIEPEEGQISEWALSYDSQGNVLSLRLVVSVSAGPDQLERYSIIQQGDNPASWEMHRITGAIPSLPAEAFFRELTAVGYRALEADLAIVPPIQAYFRVEPGTVTYGAQMRPRVIAAGQILSAGFDEITMHGDHGWVQLKQITGLAESVSTTAAYPGDSPPLILIALECSQVVPLPDNWNCSSTNN